MPHVSEQQTFMDRRPRIDPLGILPMLLPLNSRAIGEVAAPYVQACMESHADLRIRHILDLCGWALTLREQNM